MCTKVYRKWYCGCSRIADYIRTDMCQYWNDKQTLLNGGAASDDPRLMEKRTTVYRWIRIRVYVDGPEA
jgi:hypothetical protein